MKGNIIFFLPFIRKYAILNARYEYHCETLGNRFTACFDHTDADHIITMSFVGPGIELFGKSFLLGSTDEIELSVCYVNDE